jgi:hypothetical protein
VHRPRAGFGRQPASTCSRRPAPQDQAAAQRFQPRGEGRDALLQPPARCRAEGFGFGSRMNTGITAPPAAQAAASIG